MTTLEKLDFIRFAIQEANESLTGWRGYEDCDLVQALEFIDEIVKTPTINN